MTDPITAMDPFTANASILQSLRFDQLRLWPADELRERAKKEEQ